MRQRAPRHDKRVDLVVWEASLTELLQRAEVEALLHQPDEVSVGAKPAHAKHLLNAFQQARLLSGAFLSDGGLGQRILSGWWQLAYYAMASCQLDQTAARPETCRI